jgi:hypothetical protein
MEFAQRYAISDVCVLVEDLDRAVAFYVEKLGFVPLHRAPGFADFSGAGLTLALWQIDHIADHTGISRTRAPGVHKAVVALSLMTGLPMSEINGFALPLNPDCLVKSGIRLPSQPLMWESGAARCCKVSRPCRRTSPRTIPLGRRLAAGRRRSASCSGAILSA